MWTSILVNSFYKYLAGPWVEKNSKNNCPCCNSVVKTEELTPIYGAGKSEDPRNSEQYPKRPQPETEQAQRGSNGFNVGGFQFNFFAGVIPGLLGVQFAIPRAGANASDEERRRALISQILLVMPLILLIMFLFN